MKIKTSELQGAALDWAVCKAEYDELAALNILYPQQAKHYPKVSPSTDWPQGGPIIEREDISFRKYHRPGSAAHGTYYAKVCRESGQIVMWSKRYDYTGPTALVAAMRCYVASKLGGEVEVPDELVA